MTDKDALACIEDVFGSTVRYDESLEYKLTSDDFDWLEKAKEALEKQIPKKPTYTEIGNVYGAIIRTCAKCGDVCLISEDAKPFEHYCRYCGQTLDWSDTE